MNIEDVQIEQISKTVYQVKGKEGGEFRQDNIENKFCYCNFGQGGQYFMHLCAVEQKYSVLLKKISITD